MQFKTEKKSRGKKRKKQLKRTNNIKDPAYYSLSSTKTIIQNKKKTKETSGKYMDIVKCLENNHSSSVNLI
jgi:hypothetical protein